MKNRVGFCLPIVAVLLVQLGFSAHAFTLGNLRGSAVIGRPLEVNIQVQSGAGEMVSSDCVTAEVFYADVRQPSVKVSVLPATGGSGASTVHLRSSTAINEPVVTLEVSATCGSSTRRNYVLLADFPAVATPVAGSQAMPGETLALPVPVLPTLLPTEPGTATVPSQASRVGSAKSVPAQAVPRKASVKPANTASATTAAEKVVAHKVPERTSGKSVLKLDPADFLSDRIDLLDSTTLFAPTDDALRHSRQITSLEGDVKTLRALAAGNDARMSDLTAKLHQAQANQMPSWLMYAFAGMVALVLACLAAVFWLWLQLQRRMQQDSTQSWWNGSPDGSNEGPATELLVRPTPAVPETPVAPVSSAQQPLPPVDGRMAVATPLPGMPGNAVNTGSEWSMSEVDIDLDFHEPVEHVHGTFEVSTAGAPFEMNSIRHISVEPILDIRQQAEFFVSLGQTDRALQILNKQIAESADPNPLVYLDLITLYHSLGLKAEFRQRRDAFHRLFNVVIPDFPVFNLEGRDLEAYPEVLANLVSLWPSLDALVFLSACIFRDPKTLHTGTFDLAAFRDLLMLHAQIEALLMTQPAPVAPNEPAELVLTPVASTGPALKPAEESPSRMLDLDFSVLTEPEPPHKTN